MAAGISLSTLQNNLAPQTRVVRVMPNTPCLVGAGAAGVAGGTHATAQDVQKVCNLLAAVGICVEVSESKLNAVTGLSGSGPAFAYMMIEALADGGVHSGLPR